MSYVCVNRISVSGPGPKVHQFRSDARRRLPYSLPKWTAVTFVAFSLERLCHKSCLPGPSSACIPFDAWHSLASAGPMAEWHGFARIVYELEVKNYEVYELLTPLSRTYSDLCFVDSQISLDSGEIMATYIARDRCSKWILSEARCNAHWERAAASSRESPSSQTLMRTTASGATPRKACWQKPWRIGTSASCGRSDAGVLSAR